ncbi:glycosyltransferase family 2 protein [Pseudomonas sp. NPDC078700]|uniref:glycosyltransferase family 2 protein n=1 Tax=Pseudomonas sp. NPDC078700 TaxID=3364424 RepID=UPI0037C61849
MTLNRRVSVCIATYNGAPFLEEQLVSIASQLRADDEIIISDDGSQDDTLKICELVKNTFPKISTSILSGPQLGVSKNFENAILASTGDYIFLSDQDDVWLPDKLHTFLEALSHADLVLSNAYIVDSQLNINHNAVIFQNVAELGFFKNIIRNNYVGCCLAFRRNILHNALPFPSRIPMHDWWLGLIARSFNYNTFYIDKPLMLYRRHGANVSATSEGSKSSLYDKANWRLYLLSRILFRWLKAIF